MKIAHLSDTHWRNIQYHDEYREVCNRIFEDIRRENVDLIIHTGDIVHRKTDISPELVQEVSWFLKSLSNIQETHIILGNHDLNLNAKNRQDAISPIINLINSPNLILHKYSNTYCLNDDVDLYIFSLLTEPNLYSNIKILNPDKINIALYHGAVAESKTDTGHRLQGLNMAVFAPYDYVLLGDIHQHQFVSKMPPAAYAGSTIQQNFGEAAKKGYLLWDIQTKTKYSTALKTFERKDKFVTIEDEQNISNISEGVRLRIITDKELSQDTLDAISSKKLTSLKINKIDNNVVKLVKDNSTNIKKLETQNDLIKEFYTGQNIDQILELHSKYKKQLKIDKQLNTHWTIDKIEFENVFKFRGQNVIDFKNLNGILGIFGPNYSGKSSVIDILIFSIFGKCSKNINISEYLNKNSDSGQVKAYITCNNKKYEIIRKIKKSGSRTSSSVVITENGTPITKSKKTSTENLIKKLFGSYETFIRSSICTQFNTLAFVEDRNVNRKLFLSEVFELNLFSSLFDLVKSDIKQLKAQLKTFKEEYNIQPLEEELKLISIEDKADKLNSLKNELAKLEHEYDELSAQLIKIAKSGNFYPEDALDKALNRKKKLENLITVEVQDEDLQKDFSALEYTLNNTINNRKNNITYLTSKISKIKRAQQTLKGIPCNNSFPSCKFIQDANNDIDDIKSLNEEILASKKHIEIHEEEKKQINILKQSVAAYKELSFLNSKIQNIINDQKNSLLYSKVEKEKQEATSNKRNLIKEIGNIEKELTSSLYREKEIKKEILFLNQRRSQKESLINKINILSEYASLVDKSGIPYQLTTKLIPLLNNKANEFLSSIVDFKIELTDDDDKLNIRLNGLPIEVCSGAQKVLTSIALRVAFLLVSTMTRTNIFILDEPTSSLDSKHLSLFDSILFKISELFKTIMFVTHDYELKDYANHILDLESSTQINI